MNTSLPESGMEARVGIEPTNRGFADLRLTTWLPRPAGKTGKDIRFAVGIQKKCASGDPRGRLAWSAHGGIVLITGGWS